MKRTSWLLAVAFCAGLLPLAGCEKKVESPTATIEHDPNLIKVDDTRARMVLPDPKGMKK
jgi:hypothetical protein